MRYQRNKKSFGNYSECLCTLRTGSWKPNPEFVQPHRDTIVSQSEAHEIWTLCLKERTTACYAPLASRREVEAQLHWPTLSTIFIYVLHKKMTVALVLSHVLYKPVFFVTYSSEPVRPKNNNCVCHSSLLFVDLVLKIPSVFNNLAKPTLISTDISISKPRQHIYLFTQWGTLYTCLMCGKEFLFALKAFYLLSSHLYVS